MWLGKSSSSSSSSLSSSWAALVWIGLIGWSNSWIEKGNGLSVSSEAATMAKNRLKESLSSMSGKMTLSAELVIPDPSDPTALLLLATEVTNLSQNIRVKAKANAAFIEVSSLSSLSNFCQEQETARGNFPGPLPVIYCPPNNGSDDHDLAEIAAAGASGILVPLLGTNGEELTNVSDIADRVSTDTVEYCANALQNGLQPIPEIILSKSFLQQQPGGSDDDVVSSILDAIVAKCAFPNDELPAALVLSASMVDNDSAKEEQGDEDDEEEDEDHVYGLPRVSKELKKKIPVLASVRVRAGAGRVGAAVSSLKEAGYTGAALRSECVPGYRMNPDLKAVSNFWNACISDLKSVKSKNFAGFRVNSNMEKSVPMEWLKYQKSVIDSGALGDASGPPEDLESLDSDAGDFVGF